MDFETSNYGGRGPEAVNIRSAYLIYKQYVKARKYLMDYSTVYII